MEREKGSQVVTLANLSQNRAFIYYILNIIIYTFKTLFIVQILLVFKAFNYETLLNFFFIK